MENSIKKFLAILLVTVLSFTLKGQTNVSGGIFANTTWTAANSPYIITSTVVVFPGYVLTIQPGVTVKFADGQQLEIRQAQLVAAGTSSAPITFTSNSGSPSPGIYSGVYLNGGTALPSFDYCSFSWADFGIRSNATYNVSVTNSVFTSNNTGVFTGTYGLIDNCVFRSNAVEGIRVVGGTITNCHFAQNAIGMDQEGGGSSLVKNCVIDSNSTGIGTATGSILNCSFRHNGTAIDCIGAATVDSCQLVSNHSGIINIYGGNIKNSVVDSNSVVGINSVWSGNYIYNCRIRYNAIGIYDFRMGNFTYPHNTITNNVIENDSIGILLAMYGEDISCNRICNNSAYGIKYTATQNSSVANNFWCTTDSASTEVVIYDAHDNVSSGLLTIMPLDTVQCYLIPPVVTGIANSSLQDLSFTVFPNPASDQLTVNLPLKGSKAEIKIFNMTGALEYAFTTSRNSTTIDVSAFASGIYMIQVETSDSIGKQKFVKQ